MKTFSYFLFFAFIITLNACIWGVPNKTKPGITKDTLVYIYQTIHQRAVDCGTKPDSTCTVTTIKYPVFKNAIALNNEVNHDLIRSFSTDKTDTSLQLVSRNFIKSYDDFKKEDPKSFLYYSLDIYAKVLRQDSCLITLEFGGYQFTGGAHGLTYIHFINWNTKTQQNLQLSDILKPGYEQQLIKTGERIFRKDEKLADTTSLKTNYFFKDGIFSLPQSFSITPLGIRFLYNIYEIKPYSAGQTDLFIPYSQLKTLLKPNTVVTQYIK